MPRQRIEESMACEDDICACSLRSTGNNPDMLKEKGKSRRNLKKVRDRPGNGVTENSSNTKRDLLSLYLQYNPPVANDMKTQ